VCAYEISRKTMIFPRIRIQQQST